MLNERLVDGAVQMINKIFLIERLSNNSFSNGNWSEFVKPVLPFLIEVHISSNLNF